MGCWQYTGEAHKMTQLRQPRSVREALPALKAVWDTSS